MGVAAKRFDFRSQPLEERMKPWDQALRDAVVSGGAASFTSTLALGIASKLEAGHAPAALNSTSHWLWGDREAITDEVSMRHTGVGFATHHASAYMWAVLYERLAGDWAETSPAAALAAGLGTAAVACTVDYTVTPRRLTPGFELRLSRPAMAAGFVAFGLGLAAAAIARSRRDEETAAFYYPAG
jgi:hypothetical protein